MQIENTLKSGIALVETYTNLSVVAVTEVTNQSCRRNSCCTTRLTVHIEDALFVFELTCARIYVYYIA